jgi:hypothetical protein
MVNAHIDDKLPGTNERGKSGKYDENGIVVP